MLIGCSSGAEGGAGNRAKVTAAATKQSRRPYSPQPTSVFLPASRLPNPSAGAWCVPAPRPLTSLPPCPQPSPKLLQGPGVGGRCERGTAAEMLLFLPNMPEDRINQHRKLNTVPWGALLPTPACAKCRLAPESRSPGRPAGPGNPAQVAKFRRASSSRAPLPRPVPSTSPTRRPSEPVQ